MSPIRKAREPADIEAVTALVWEFFGFLKTRYPDRHAMIDAYIADQDVAGQLADFHRHFTPPNGECLLAEHDGAPVGIVMIRPEAEGVAELNRMYVVPRARGLGLGKALCLELIGVARDLDYAELRLDAVDGHIEALPLYRSLGFLPDPDPPAFSTTDPSIVPLRRTI